MNRHRSATCFRSRTAGAGDPFANGPGKNLLPCRPISSYACCRHFLPPLSTFLISFSISSRYRSRPRSRVLIASRDTAKYADIRRLYLGISLSRLVDCLPVWCETIDSRIAVPTRQSAGCRMTEPRKRRGQFFKDEDLWQQNHLAVAKPT